MNATHASAEEPTVTTNPSPIAQSSDLSSALAAGEWTRIDAAVERGLQWLADNQAEDGSVPGLATTQPAVTSLAVMAFLSKGHQPNQGRYGDQLTRAIDYVLATQNRRGIFSAARVVPSGEHLGRRKPRSTTTVSPG